jgi:hypothetical protein
VAQLDDVGSIGRVDSAAMRRGSRWPAGPIAFAVLLALAACDSTAPSAGPSGQAVASGGPGATGGPGASGPTRTTQPPDPRPPTAASKIEAAVEAGTLDAATGVLYRIYATFGDSRLPDAFRGEPADDPAVFTEAARDIDAYPTDVQAALRPFLLRPADPASIWSSAPAARAPGSDIVLAAAHPPVPDVPGNEATPVCDGLWAKQASPTLPVVVWGQCIGDVNETFRQMERVELFITQLWGPMTQLMGEPIGDANIANDGLPDTVENGDGKLDIYITKGFQTSTPRSIGTGALASAKEWPPYVGSSGSEASSAYLIVDPGTAGDDELKSTVAHEFFHALENAHNVNGTWYCTRSARCAGQYHWFVEASAVWAEHHFVPEARASEVYFRYRRGFRLSPNGLNFVDKDNEYDSFMWPLFMEQERGKQAIAQAWTAFEGEKGYASIQGQLDSILSFEGHFREFAVRAWNEDMPGDPISPRFQDLDNDFPRVGPTTPKLYEGVDFELDALFTSTDTGQAMWSWYEPFYVGQGAHRVSFDFSALPEEFRVDVLLMINDKWEHRELPNSKVKLCLDMASDAVQAGILVFSDHDQLAAPHPITGTWTAIAEAAGCSAVTGSVSYESRYDNGFGGIRIEKLSAQISLREADNHDQFAAEFLNDGSSGSATLETHTVSPPGPDGCSITAQGAGHGSIGPEPDAVVGNLTMPDDKWVFTVAISIPMMLEVDENWCVLGPGHSSVQDGVSIPSLCDGVEQSGATPGPGATRNVRTFVINCQSTTPGWVWKVTGTIQVVTSAIPTSP